MKAQVSFEFIMIFALVLFALMGFMFVINQRLADVNMQREERMLKDMTDNVVNEVLLASSVSDNYLRYFSIPTQINGRDYSMAIENDDEIYIELYEDDRIINQYHGVLPKEVKGTFIDYVTPTTTDHCITKSDYDGIRIARNQVALTSPGHTPGQPIEVYVWLFCVKNIRSARFTISYNTDYLKLTDFVPVTRASHPTMSTLFDQYSVVHDYNSADPDQDIVLTPTGQRLDMNATIDNVRRETFGYQSTSCATGSGIIAKLTFEAVTNIPTETDIIFEPSFRWDNPDYVDEDIYMFDCSTNQFTTKSLPDSRQDLEIKLN